MLIQNFFAFSYWLDDMQDFYVQFHDSIKKNNYQRQACQDKD